MHSPNVLYPSLVRVRRSSLDRRIAEGARPVEGRELELRSEQLESLRCRRGLAVNIRRLLEAAEEPPSVFSSSAPLQRRQILRARTLLEKLADDLQVEGEVSARGVALTELLLTDGSSPVYAPHPDEALDSAVRHARTALLLA